MAERQQEFYPWNGTLLLTLACGALVTAVFGVLLLLRFLDPYGPWNLFVARHSGFCLTRTSPASMEISWGTESRVIISPQGRLRFWAFQRDCIRRIGEDPYPPLSRTDSLWTFEAAAELEGAEEAFPSGYVNPKLSNAEARAFALMDMVSAKRPDWDAVTRAVAESYVYLGYVVRDEEEARALRDALTDRSKVDLNADLATPYGIIRRLRVGVEKEFASNPNDEAVLADIRKRIPILFEAMNARAGHPLDSMCVLYLDGHIEVIPFGERFPANQAFVDAFPPPLPGSDR